MAKIEFQGKLTRRFGFKGPVTGKHYRYIPGDPIEKDGETSIPLGEPVEVNDADAPALEATGVWKIVGNKPMPPVKPKVETNAKPPNPE